MSSSQSTRPFDPDWCVRPGTTLREWRDENGLSIGAAASACRMGMDLYRRIEDGLTEIDPVIAGALKLGTGVSAQFWLNRERHYRDDLAAGKRDMSDA